MEGQMSEPTEQELREECPETGAAHDWKFTTARGHKEAHCGRCMRPAPSLETLLARLNQRAVPEGWQLVPKELTEKMERAVIDAEIAFNDENGFFEQIPLGWGPVYKAMLAAVEKKP
jgi:hypothetical protein